VSVAPSERTNSAQTRHRLVAAAIACGVFSLNCATDTGTRVSPGPDRSEPAADTRCQPEDFEDVIQAEIDESGSPVELEGVDVDRCQDGFARVGAVPTKDNFETEQFFLRYERAWTIVNYGTGITCEDSDLDADTREVCERLGYDVATPRAS
jgi:hypothetical protein